MTPYTLHFPGSLASGYAQPMGGLAWRKIGRWEKSQRISPSFPTLSVSRSGCCVSSVLSTPLDRTYHGSAPGRWLQPLGSGDHLLPVLLQPLGRWQLTNLQTIHLLPFVLKV